MTENNSIEESAQIEAVQAVVDRVLAWQHGATDGVVHDELRAGLDEVGVTITDSQFEALAEAIEADDGPIDASKALA